MAFSLFVVQAGEPEALLGISFVIGLLLGFMQKKGLAEGMEEFNEASSMLEIRRILKSTKWGKRYIIGFWVSAILLLVLSWFLSSYILLGYTMSFCMVFGTRDCVTLKSTIKLSQLGSS